jgi:hypothetical protein
MPPAAVVSALARSLLAGEQTVAAAHARALRTLGRPRAWLERLSIAYIERFAAGIRPRHREVVRFLLDDPGFLRAARRSRLSVAHWLEEPQRIHPVEAATHWDLPGIETVSDLSRWLSVHPTELEWFADLRHLCQKLDRPKLHHYHYRLIPKRSGGVRLLETPKPELKDLQRRILSAVLDRVPPHPAVHGFVKGRSIATFAAPHTSRLVVLRLDLDNFFPTFPAARIQALFRTFGYPEPVADRLGGICSNAAPHSLWRDRPIEIAPRLWIEARALYTRAHLPQGAPTSPSLANLTAYRLDCRLAGLARSAGAVYTRYADDLAFSGGVEFHRVVERFSAHAAAIALEEGFTVNHHKTRIMRRGTRQSLAGLVINDRLNLRRCDLELLEATLINCARHGPQSQNRCRVPDFRAHLEGRIGYVEMINPERARRLKAIFHSIRW